MGLYSHYDGAHNHPVNRALHMIAIPDRVFIADRGVVSLGHRALAHSISIRASMVGSPDRGEQAGISHESCACVCCADVDGAKDFWRG